MLGKTWNLTPKIMQVSLVGFMQRWMNERTNEYGNDNSWTSKSLNLTCKRVFQQSHVGSAHAKYLSQGFLLTHLLIQNIFGEWMFSNPSFYTTNLLEGRACLWCLVVVVLAPFSPPLLLSRVNRRVINNLISNLYI